MKEEGGRGGTEEGGGEGGIAESEYLQGDADRLRVLVGVSMIMSFWRCNLSV